MLVISWCSRNQKNPSLKAKGIYAAKGIKDFTVCNKESKRHTYLSLILQYQIYPVKK